MAHNFDESEEESARRLAQNGNEDRGPKCSHHPVNFVTKIDEIRNMFRECYCTDVVYNETAMLSNTTTLVSLPSQLQYSEVYHTRTTVS